MGWGTHPDTVACAAATGAANHSGHPERTLGWWKTYRDHYAATNNSLGGSLERYLEKLDARIAQLEDAPEGAVARAFR